MKAAPHRSKNLDAKLAFTIDETVIVSGLGRSSLYEAIAGGKLVPKYNSRTLITRTELVRFSRSFAA